MSEDKAIHTLYERIGHLFCEQPYGELVEAKSPKDAIEKVNCDQLTYLPKGADDE